jgi:hypothetical protein
VALLPVLLALPDYLAALMLAALGIFYAIWTQHMLRGMKPGAEALSLHDSMILQSRAHRPSFLLLLLLGGIVCIAICLLLLVNDPDDWFIPSLAIALFGPGTLSVLFILILRRRELR